MQPPVTADLIEQLLRDGDVEAFLLQLADQARAAGVCGRVKGDRTLLQPGNST